MLALTNNQSVFALVILAWSALASAFAPLLIACCLGQTPSERTSLISVVTGLATALFCRFMGWEQFVYEGLPGIMAGLLVIAIGNGLVRNPLQQPEQS